MPFRSPLHEIESTRGAAFADCHGWEVAEHFGDPAGEYCAIRGATGALDLCSLGKLRIAGRDRVRYLHNMVSNDIRNLKPGTGCYATLLTHQGRMESDLFVYAFDDDLRIEISPAGRERAIATLCKYVVADDVHIEDQTGEVSILSLQGPLSGAVMERTAGIQLSDLGLLQHRTVERPAAQWVIVRRDRTGCDGYDLWLPGTDAAAVWQLWIEMEGIQAVGHRALNWLRTEAGIPWFGADMHERDLPMEFGLSSAISLTKGCYRGQEIVARVHYRGHLDRCLGAIAVQHDEPPASGAEIRSGGAKIGEVTSATFSPRLRRPLTLCILKSDFLLPGTPVEVAYGRSLIPAEVISLPLR